jgi:hypothetical protein
VLAGGFYSFGHGGNWMKPRDWKQWLDSPGARQMKLLRDLFETLDWWRLVPDGSLVRGQPGEVAAARAADRGWALIYLPTSASVTIDMGAVNAEKSVEASWTDPASGAVQRAGLFPATDAHTFAPPAGWADALLVLRSRSSR